MPGEQDVREYLLSIDERLGDLLPESEDGWIRAEVREIRKQVAIVLEKLYGKAGT